ncbi:MAG: arylsulfatase [Kiritimatiellaeota bacterium]|nr:arylsulfatase [Kiritimatiellota bacterium]
MQTNTRRDFLKCAALGVAGSLVFPRLGKTAPAAFQSLEISDAPPLAGRRPNIILILTDDQGYGDASCNGNPILKTPNIDRLHGEGVHFEDFHVSPTCAPTRSSIMSGKHEFKNGITHTIFERERMSLKTTTVAQVLKSAGYATGIFGKWHLGDEDAYQPERRGLDEVFIHGGGGIGQHYVGSCADAPGNTYFDPVIKHNGVFEKTSGYCTDVFFAQALKWIGAVKGKQPFFTYITPNAPHGPLQVRPEDEARYAGRVKPNEAKFFGMVANIDDNVGRVLTRLQEWGLDRDTLVVFINDNGGTAGCQVFNAGMRGQKGTAFNGGTRAMSLWRWPGTLSAAGCDKLTAHVDLFPTFAELAGVKILDEVHAQQDGFSLAPLLVNPQAAWPGDRMLFTHVGRWDKGGTPQKHGACSVRWQQWLLVREKEAWALHDLRADPSEKADVAAQHAGVVAKLDAAFDRWWTVVLPCLEHEDAYKTAPAVAPFYALYRNLYQRRLPSRRKLLSCRRIYWANGGIGRHARLRS